MGRVLAAHHRDRKYVAGELAEQLQISLAQVHAALAYDYAHQEEIDAQIEAEDRLIGAAKDKGLGQRHPPVLG